MLADPCSVERVGWNCVPSNPVPALRSRVGRWRHRPLVRLDGSRRERRGCRKSRACPGTRCSTPHRTSWRLHPPRPCALLYRRSWRIRPAPRLVRPGGSTAPAPAVLLRASQAGPHRRRHRRRRCVRSSRRSAHAARRSRSRPDQAPGPAPCEGERCSGCGSRPPACRSTIGRGRSSVRCWHARCMAESTRDGTPAHPLRRPARRRGAPLAPQAAAASRWRAPSTWAASARAHPRELRWRAVLPPGKRLPQPPPARRRNCRPGRRAPRVERVQAHLQPPPEASFVHRRPDDARVQQLGENHVLDEDGPDRRPCPADRAEAGLPHRPSRGLPAQSRPHRALRPRSSRAPAEARYVVTS
jgi:hypothetical protein